MTSIKAVIFDLDGTLVDSESWHKSSEVEALRRFGIKLDVEELDQYMGTTLRDMLRRLGCYYSVDISVDSFLAFQMPILTRHIRERVEMYPDAAECLNCISGYRLALATSSMRWYLDEILSRFPLIAERFPIVVCEEDISRSKPDPETFQLAVSRLGLRPEECAVVEDSPHGILAAKRAGCYVIGVDRLSSRNLTAADALIPTLSQLEKAMLRPSIED